MRLSKLTTLLSILLLAAMFTGCTRIGPGHAGIVVNAAGSDKGVSEQTATTGWFFYNPFSQTVIEYQTAVRQEKWTRDQNEGKPGNTEVSFTNKDQMVIYADVAIAFSLDPAKVPAFYVKFLAHDEDDLDSKFTNGFLRNAVRNCLNDNAGQYDIHQIMGDNAEFLHKTQDCIQGEVAPWGVHIDQFGFIGAPRPPQAVTDSINAKAQAEQIATQKQIELAQTQADAAKNVAKANGEAQAILAVADAQAKANKELAASLSDELIRYKAIEKWNGERPQVEGANGGVLFNLNK